MINSTSSNGYAFCLVLETLLSQLPRSFFSRSRPNEFKGINRMNKLIKFIAVIAIMSTSLAGNAALITYNFDGEIESIFSREKSYECLLSSCGTSVEHTTIKAGDQFSGQFIFDLNTPSKDGGTQTAAFYSSKFYTQDFLTFPGDFSNIALRVTEQAGGNVRRYMLQNLYWKTSDEGDSRVLPYAFDFSDALFALAPAAGCDRCTVGGRAHVTIATSVPEPSILALFAIGLLGMTLAWRKYC